MLYYSHHQGKNTTHSILWILLGQCNATHHAAVLCYCPDKDCSTVSHKHTADWLRQLSQQLWQHFHLLISLSLIIINVLSTAGLLGSRPCMQIAGQPSDLTSYMYMYPTIRLELWPGFATAIWQYKNQIMLCTKVTHRLLHTDIICYFLKEPHGCNPCSFTSRSDAIRALVGEIVLTKYANACV